MAVLWASLTVAMTRRPLRLEVRHRNRACITQVPPLTVRIGPARFGAHSIFRGGAGVEKRKSLRCDVFGHKWEMSPVKRLCARCGEVEYRVLIKNRKPEGHVWSKQQDVAETDRYLR